jgi:hypothetical protein
MVQFLVMYVMFLSLHLQTITTVEAFEKTQSSK